jgi:hypothetical protein
MTKRDTSEDLPEEDLRKSEEDSMDEQLTKKVEELEGQVEALTAQLEKANKVAELTDAHKEFHKGLEEEAADEFLAKSAEERDELIKSAAEADETVEVDGFTMKKSVLGEESFAAMVALNEKLEKAKEEARLAEEKVELEQLRKRAAELEHLPADEEAKIAMLKAIDSIADEAQREAVLAGIKANNEKMQKAFEEVAHQSPKEESPSEQLDRMAKSRADSDGVSYTEAYAEVLQTAEGQALYEQVQSK